MIDYRNLAELSHVISRSVLRRYTMHIINKIDLSEMSAKAVNDVVDARLGRDLLSPGTAPLEILL